ncbi:MAG: 16S rRNA (cytosine(1402)-N(4))-methyltransferase RsmH [Rickettsiales bacterium]
MSHVPVMLREVLQAVAAKDGDIVVDGTFGAGGYARGILGAASCRVVALDRDPDVQLLADALARETLGHFLFLPGRFGAMVSLLNQAGIEKVDAIVLDIGVSSMQLDQGDRGFSFRAEAPLDMRMERAGISAYDVVNSYSESELIRILREYGEEKNAKRIAHEIMMERSIGKITTTKQLATIVDRVSFKRGHVKIHPATRTFQAIRIEVNQELVELQAALDAALKLLKPGGRLVVVTFHSLEDRIVKQFMQNHSDKAQGSSRHLPLALVAPQHNAAFSKVSRVLPSDGEIVQNVRARSATLRCAIRSGVAA